MKDILSIIKKYAGSNDVSDPRFFWLLIGVDYSFIQEEGLQGLVNFEFRETGSLAGMCKGFLDLVTKYATAEEKFNILHATSPESQKQLAEKMCNRLCAYHKACIEGVHRGPSSTVHKGLLSQGKLRTTEGYMIQRDAGAYRSIQVEYGFRLQDQGNKKTNGSEQGLAYLQSRTVIRGPIENGKVFNLPKYYAIVYEEKRDLYKIVCTDQTQDIQALTNYITMRFIQDIQAATDEDQKLEYIAEYIQDLMALHPFKDGNNRTLVGLMLNEILLDLGLSPTVFYQPNVFDGFAPKELVGKIKEAQQLFKNIRNGVAPLPEGLQYFNSDLFYASLLTRDLDIVKLTLGEKNPSDTTLDFINHIMKIKRLAIHAIRNEEKYTYAFKDYEFLQVLMETPGQSVDDKVKIMRELIEFLPTQTEVARFLLRGLDLSNLYNNPEVAKWCKEQVNLCIGNTPLNIHVLYLMLKTKHPFYIGIGLTKEYATPNMVDIFSRGAQAYFSNPAYQHLHNSRDLGDVLCSEEFLNAILQQYPYAKYKEYLSDFIKLYTRLLVVSNPSFHNLYHTIIFLLRNTDAIKATDVFFNCLKSHSINVSDFSSEEGSRVLDYIAKNSDTEVFFEHIFDFITSKNPDFSVSSNKLTVSKIFALIDTKCPDAQQRQALIEQLENITGIKKESTGLHRTPRVTRNKPL